MHIYNTNTQHSCIYCNDYFKTKSYLLQKSVRMVTLHEPAGYSDLVQLSRQAKQTGYRPLVNKLFKNGSHNGVIQPNKVHHFEITASIVQYM